jgi:GNAT superfamily N-acetyltransferase
VLLAGRMERSPHLGVMAHPEGVAADVDDVAAVKKPVDQRGGHDLVAEDLAPLMPTFERAGEILRQLLACEDVTVLVAVDAAEGAVVGTLTLVLVPNLTYARHPWGMIENVVVDQPWRGRGIGRQLMQHAVTLAEQSGCYKIQLLSGRKAEQVTFYADLGFDSSGSIGHKAYLGRNQTQAVAAL